MKKFIFTSLFLLTFIASSSPYGQENNSVDKPMVHEGYNPDDSQKYQIIDSVCKTYVEWTGMHIDKIDLSVLGDRPYRVLKPDSMATMDYSPDRLNIMTTQDGIILTQECG